MPKKKPRDDDSSNKSFDFHKTNKDNIKNVVWEDSTIEITNDLVIRTNKIVIHAYQFMKLYFLHLYENNYKFHLIDKEFILDVFKTITIRQCGSGGYNANNMPTQLELLTNFYEGHYKQTIVEDDILYYDKMSYILSYEAITMETCIGNNIKLHFVSRVHKFVNVIHGLSDKIAEVDKITKDKKARNEMKKVIYNEFKLIKNDILNFGEYTSDEKYHAWITEVKKHILPKKKEFDKDSVFYDVKSNPQDYLRPTIYMAKELEPIYNEIKLKNDKIRKQNEKIQEKNDKITNEKDKIKLIKYIEQIKLFNILPLRTNIVPKNITIDTCGLIQNFPEESTSEHLKNYKKEDNQATLWKRFFAIDNCKTFKKKHYSFHYMIKTDGISISVLFIRNDENGNPLCKFQRKKSKTNNKKDDDDEDNNENVQYIEKVNITKEMKKKKVVCIDPNMSDLIYCSAYNKADELETFRYTKNQRRLETRTKKYSKISDFINKRMKVNGKTIKQIESTLSEYNSKTNNYDTFKKYVIEKNKINSLLFEHYKNYMWRKFKLNRYINTQKSESKMIKNFEKKFGSNKEILIAMGDHDRLGHMKGLEPVICKKFRRIFRNAGYETYLVNEFRTSITCSCCNGELESFLKRPSNKPKNKGEIITVHGLLRCTNEEQKCQQIHNRDTNAVKNMLNIVQSIFETGKRPTIFSRKTEEQIHTHAPIVVV